MEGDHPATGGEHDVLAGAGGAAEPDRHRLADGVLHLRGDRAHPDQLVEPELVTGQAGLGGRAERVAGGPDRLVRLLRVLHLRGVGARRVGDVLRAVQVACLAPRRRDRRLRQRRGVGAHVGDVAVLVEPLRHRHRRGGAEAELAAGLLLQRRGPERRVGPAACRAATRPSARRTSVSCRASASASARRLVEVDHALAGGPLGQLAVGSEVAAAGDPGVVDRVQLGREHPLVVLLAGVEGGLEVPVRRDPEAHPLPLAVHDQPRGDRLHAAGGEARHHLAPQHRADLVAVEAVEDAARLLGLDEVHVDLARVRRRRR